tara:strand:- start:339 stop:1175 length:837 start_codon:yes stop_codon:yes gene_type:complete
MNKFFLLVIIFSFILGEKIDRIISIGGCVTETVFALNQGEKVVAVDISSTIPNKVKKLPQVGYIRAISSEGILSMMPDYILTTSDLGPPKVVDQLRKSGVKMKIFDSPHSLDGIIDLVDNISVILDVQEQGKLVIDKMKKESKIMNEKIDNYAFNPKIVFFMNPSIGSYTAAGNTTRANYLIQFLGGKNIFSDQFSKYKKVTKEEILKFNPDIILVSSYSSNDQKSSSIFIDSDDFKSVSAVLNNRVVDIDMGKLLSFGPSFTSNVLELINTFDINQK